MIRLDCPQCHRSLEIDDGFAGGVCRCFNCGTLMTVPAAGGQAERLTPGTPGSSGGRSARPDRPDVPGGAPAAAAQPKDQPEVFVTSTGKTIKLTHDQVSHIAVARKGKPRMGLRIGIIVGFIVVVLGMFVTIAVLGTRFLDEQAKEQQIQQQKRDGGKDLSKQVLAYNPDANPLLLTTANLFGNPVTDDKQSIVLVIDSSAAMRDYLDFAISTVEANLKTLPDAASIQLIFADETGLHVMPDAPSPVSQWKPDELKQLLDTLRPVGIQNLPAALEKAAAAKPDRIVMVTSMAPVKPEMDKMDQALAVLPDVVFDIDQLGRDNEALHQMATGHKGQYLNLPEGQIQNWYVEYQQKK